MKNLLELNTTKLIDTYKNTGKFSLTNPYHNKKNAFIMHMLALFSQVPLVRNDKTSMYSGTISASKTLSAMPDVIATPEGVFPRSKIIELLWIAKNVSRGKLLSLSQVKDPKYGAMTPLFMYAHKRDNGVKYSEWNHKDSKINAVLGEFLAKANDFRLAYPTMLLETNSSQRRALAKDYKYTDWNPYCAYSVNIDPVDGEQEGEIIRIPKEVSLMHNQFWIANAEVRDTSTMLLDIYNYGRVPEAIDAIKPITSRTLEDEL